VTGDCHAWFLGGRGAALLTSYPAAHGTRRKNYSLWFEQTFVGLQIRRAGYTIVQRRFIEQLKYQKNDA
jgi:hypothetical protein